MPSVSAQDSALEPARITKGIIIPLRMNRGDFFVSGASWVKFRVLRPWASFEQFLASREAICDECNLNTIHFFEEFQSDPERHARILAGGQCFVWSSVFLFARRHLLFAKRHPSFRRMNG